jgi:hypothetical protein
MWQQPLHKTTYIYTYWDVYISIVVLERYIRVVIERMLDGETNKMIEGNRKRKKVTMTKHLGKKKKLSW